MAIKTQAWVLYAGGEDPTGRGELVLEDIEVPPIDEHECLVRPLYGCWEGNMGQALERNPYDICRHRGEERVVLGNSGVVEVVEVGSSVTIVRPGDRAIVFCNGEWDSYGYPKTIFGYDTPHTIGMLAKMTKLHQRQLIPVPRGDDGVTVEFN